MIADIFGIASVIAGAFFLLTGGIGLIRLPDFYCRNHATGKSDTLGIMLVIFGLMLIEGLTLNSAKLFFALVFVLLTNPTGTHALANAALHSGLMPWFRKDKGKEGESCTGKSK
jgi:multicomponent Na+:H+ antiporter subunit G